MQNNFLSGDGESPLCREFLESAMKLSLVLILATALSSLPATAAEPDTKKNQSDAATVTTPAQLAATDKIATEMSKDPAQEQKKLVLPNASDFVLDGIGCGTAK